MNRLTSIIRSTSVLIKIWPRFNCFFFLSNIWKYFKLWSFILTKDNENLLGSGLVGPGSSRVERLISEMRNLTRWVDSGSKITGRRGERSAGGAHQQLRYSWDPGWDTWALRKTWEEEGPAMSVEDHLTVSLTWLRAPLLMSYSYSG